MLVSWDWLKQYVTLDVSVEELSERFTMSGLNLEEFHAVGNDTCIDLEVTSNRPDCLGHLGIAREAAVLLGQTLKVPAASPKCGTSSVASVRQIVHTNKNTAAPNISEMIAGGIGLTISGETASGTNIITGRSF